MDPDTLLADLESELAKVDSDDLADMPDREVIRECVTKLRDWIQSGGNPPDWFKAPHATALCIGYGLHVSSWSLVQMTRCP